MARIPQPPCTASRTLGSRELVTTTIEPLPPLDSYNSVRIGATSHLAAPQSAGTLFGRHRPGEYKDDEDVMGDIKRYIDDKLLLSGLKWKVVVVGRVGLQSSSSPRNPYHHEVVECGLSIGLAGEGWSGSFGGYLLDESSGDIFGVTCAHNMCRYDWDTEGITADQLVELLPTE
ncbi:hypothetical protein K440DRAFT_641778 [Wilcoxina mikolae CBS 423.85]|nr:hypothetical protein K440DRAFT_641778 [Wilcoxina mikolae CBS 423.85]